MEIEIQRYVAKTIVVDADMFAEKPSEGVNLVIFSPTVLITLCPSVANPKTILPRQLIISSW